MGHPTGRILKELRTTGKGSDHYGPCDKCGKSVGEAFVMQDKREYQRPNDELYLAAIGGGTYGHRDCLIQAFGAPDIDRTAV